MAIALTRFDRWTPLHLAGAIAMGLLGVLATAGAWADIRHIALDDPEYSHIFLVPIVAAWLVWVRRARVRYTRPVGLLIGPIFAGLGWAISSYGFYNGHQSLWHAGAVLTVVGCVLSVLGRQVFFRFLPAFAVLIFLIPVPGRIRVQIAHPLQDKTSLIADEALSMIGLEVERSGNLLTYNGMPVNIVEACNGLRGVFGLVLVSFAFSFGLPLKNWVRLLVLLASPIAAIFCNVIRILPTVWMYGNYPRPVIEDRPSVAEWLMTLRLIKPGESFGDLFHNSSGWVMLPLSFLLLLAIMRTLRWAMIPVMRFPLASQGA